MTTARGARGPPAPSLSCGSVGTPARRRPPPRPLEGLLPRPDGQVGCVRAGTHPCPLASDFARRLPRNVGP